MPRHLPKHTQPELLPLPALPRLRKAPAAAKPRLRREGIGNQAVLAWDGAGLVAGVDEAGRGPLAGCVVAAAVILDEQQPVLGLRDSKKLTALQRDQLFDEIQAKALCVSVGAASVEEIDRLNILQATMLAMQRAVQGLRLRPSKVLVDGNRVPQLDMAAEAIIGGDAKVTAISAASIIAKVTRDRQCDELHRRYPEYGFDRHKGYGTAAHLAALDKHGITTEHRKSYAPVAQAMRHGAA